MFAFMPQRSRLSKCLHAFLFKHFLSSTRMHFLYLFLYHDIDLESKM